MVKAAALSAVQVLLQAAVQVQGWCRRQQCSGQYSSTVPSNSTGTAGDTGGIVPGGTVSGSTASGGITDDAWASSCSDLQAAAAGAQYVLSMVSALGLREAGS